MFDIINVLIQSIQSIAIILIFVGMLIAFLWKAAFYLNLALGVIITVLVTYLVNAVSGDAGLTATVFLLGLVGSVIVAAIGASLCLLEGFILSSLGFWAYWVLGSPASILSPQILAGSAVASVVSTGVAAYLGDRALSLNVFDRIRKGTTFGKVKKTWKTNEPMEIEILPEKPFPSTKSDRVDNAVKKRIYGYVLAYRKFKLTEIAERFGLDKNKVEDILLEFIADGKINGLMDPETGIFTLSLKKEER